MDYFWVPAGAGWRGSEGLGNCEKGRKSAEGENKGLDPKLLLFETLGFSYRLLIELIFSITDLGGKCKKGRKF